MCQGVAGAGCRTLVEGRADQPGQRATHPSGATVLMPGCAGDVVPLEAVRDIGGDEEGVGCGVHLGLLRLV